MELLSLLGGGIAGFIFKYMSQMQMDRQAQFEMMLKRIEAEDVSKDKAAQRAPGKAGEWTRRLIIIAILFGVILAPFLLVLLDKPVVVEITTPIKSWLGLIETGGKTKFYELSSYLLIPELRSALLALVGYYFGSSSAKRSNN